MLPSSYFGIPGSWNVLLNLLFSLLCVCVFFFSSYHWKALIYFYFDHFCNFRACGQSKRTRGFKDITLFYLLNINQGSPFWHEAYETIAVVINSLALKWQCLKLNLIGLSYRARLTLFCYVTICTIHSHENTVQRDLYFKVRKLCSHITHQKLKMGSALSSYKSKRRDKKEYKRWVNIFLPLEGKHSDALATRFCFPWTLITSSILFKFGYFFSVE